MIEEFDQLFLIRAFLIERDCLYILVINRKKFKVKMAVKSYDLLCITAFVMASRDERG
jgi:hypothetical protein